MSPFFMKPTAVLVKITISCDFPASNYAIYYSTDGGDPTTPYPVGGISFTDYGFTVKAIATATG